MSRRSSSFSYNSRATLRCALQSLIAQKFADFEAWIIGDACTDGSEEEVAALGDARFHWFNLAQNSGHQWRPNNEGLKRARGRYVAYLGHDDLWLPWHLSTLVSDAEKSGADFVHDLLVNIGPNGILDLGGPPAEGVTYERHGFPPSSWLHRRELVEKIGLWRNPADLSWSGDYDFTRRIFLAGLRMDFVSSLGVVKFPARPWRNYSATAAHPQTAALEAMAKDPTGFAAQVLLDSAVSFSRLTRQGAKQPLKHALREAASACLHVPKVLVRAAIDFYGRERWPLRALLSARMRRTLERNRVESGIRPGT